MPFRERKLILRELIADGSVDNLDGLRVSSEDLAGLIPHFFAGVELPQGFDRKTMSVVALLENRGVLYDALRPSARQPKGVKSDRKRGRYAAARQLGVRDGRPNGRMVA